MTTRILFVLFISCSVSAHYGEKKFHSTPEAGYNRVKRNAVGALHIVTNHAQPIHADVKSDGDGTEKPCPEGSRPGHVESGAGFKVTAPEDAVYTMKSLRKSLPADSSPTTLDVVRSVSRIVTILILFISAVCEFYPTVLEMIMTIYLFINQ
ncbi:uncharacterized protein LOC142984267 isoform X1 [Anticarsia gemmatalis]|uniref:uncharacterized protein LOC142984267 isoform X1 n=1 Tax=Anticarsia gemmatalis TaxID=129554 RepID=UPI003F764CE0